MPSKYSEAGHHLRQARSVDSVTDLTSPIRLIHKGWRLQDSQTVSVLFIKPGDIVFFDHQRSVKPKMKRSQSRQCLPLLPFSRRRQRL
jgi:hypothetical protein